jgi:hypothetical protein
VGHGDDPQLFLGNLVYDAIRKSPQEMPTARASKDCADLVIGQNRLDRSLEFRDERQPSSRFALAV